MRRAFASILRISARPKAVLRIKLHSRASKGKVGGKRSANHFRRVCGTTEVALRHMSIAGFATALFHLFLGLFHFPSRLFCSRRVLSLSLSQRVIWKIQKLPRYQEPLPRILSSRFQIDIKRFPLPSPFSISRLKGPIAKGARDTTVCEVSREASGRILLKVPDASRLNELRLATDGELKLIILRNAALEVD